MPVSRPYLSRSRPTLLLALPQQPAFNEKDLIDFLIRWLAFECGDEYLGRIRHLYNLQCHGELPGGRGGYGSGLLGGSYEEVLRDADGGT